MKKGGLVNELEQKIKNIKDYQAIIEEHILSYENENNKLNLKWAQSYEYTWLKNLLHFNNNNDLINYRQSIVDKLCKNNNLINDLKIKLNYSENFYNFLYKIYNVLIM